ncbi:MAG: class I SAM-dependent methyltransferase [Myxococcaceae bacterium]
MRLNNYRDRLELLIEWILQTAPAGGRVLDVGANDGSFCPQVEAIARHAGHFAGVDPDTEKLARHPLLHARYPATLEEAQLPESSFDCLYAIYVLEHVQEPERFLKAAARALKPGGSLFFITPNGGHYFATIAGLLGRVGLQRQVLERLFSKESVGRYHYPAAYLLNHPARISAMAARCGLTRSEYRYSEKDCEFFCYFPGPAKVFPWLWQNMARLSGREQLLGNLMGRLVKAPERQAPQTIAGHAETLTMPPAEEVRPAATPLTPEPPRPQKKEPPAVQAGGSGSE